MDRRPHRHRLQCGENCRSRRRPHRRRRRRRGGHRRRRRCHRW